MQYELHKQYTRKLSFVRDYGDARQRVVILKDEEECQLIWVTRDSHKEYQYFKNQSLYSFKVDWMFCDKISITNLRKVGS